MRKNGNMVSSYLYQPKAEVKIPDQHCPLCQNRILVTANDGGSLLCNCSGMSGNLFHLCRRNNPKAQLLNGHYVAFDSPGPGLCSYCQNKSD